MPKTLASDIVQMFSFRCFEWSGIDFKLPGCKFTNTLHVLVSQQVCCSLLHWFPLHTLFGSLLAFLSSLSSLRLCFLSDTAAFVPAFMPVEAAWAEEAAAAAGGARGPPEPEAIPAPAKGLSRMRRWSGIALGNGNLNAHGCLHRRQSCVGNHPRLVKS